MKRTAEFLKFTVWVTSLWLVTVSAHSLPVNYVRTYTTQVEGIKTHSQVKIPNPVQVRQNTDYLDGRARVIQNVTRRGSPFTRDVVNIINYDQFGRTNIDYLPFTVNEINGDFKTFDPSSHPLAKFYQANNDKVANTLTPYAVKKYDNSPLNRITEQGAPGEAWQPTSEFGESHTLRYIYQSNRPQDAVLRWEPYNGGLRADDTYPPQSLYVEIQIDEHNLHFWTFTDKQGRKILEMREADSGEKLYTYFAYDDKGNLSYVVPPKTVAELANGMPKVITKSNLVQGGYYYRYDARSRIIEKHLPGAEPVFLVYDPWDRLILTQDGEQREDKKWGFNKYDAFDRAIITGEIIIEGSRSQVEQKINNFYSAVASSPNIRFEGKGEVHGYTNRSYPLLADTVDVYTVTFFDDYSFLSEFLSPAGYNFQAELGLNSPIEKAAGQLTGTKVRILGTPDYRYSVTYYDDEYRPIQIISSNHKDGKDRLTQIYSFKGRLLKSLHTHDQGANATTVLRDYVHDHAERLVKTYHKIDDEEKVLLYKQKYNEIGELVEKNLFSIDDDEKIFAQSVDYRYNIRGWLTSINNVALNSRGDMNDDDNDFFGMELYYNDETNALGNVAQYNGNVSAVKWNNTRFREEQNYVYNYDAYNRLKSAQYKNFSHTEQGVYDVGGSDGGKIDYDANGNILSLKRYGWHSSDKLLIDDLIYTYEGNQLTKVIDASGRHEGFHAPRVTGDAYSYDANGNMIIDRNKEITISYNHMNLPERIEKISGETIQYGYDANGVKLSQKVFDASNTLTQSRDYVGAFVYKNEALQFVHHDEGRIIPNPAGSGWAYQYFLKDHLGNVRLTFAEQDAEANLIKNPGFEEGTTGWRFIRGGALTDEVPHSGTAALSMPPSERYQLVTQKVAVEPGRTYRLSGWLKTESLNGKALFYYRLRDAADANRGMFIVSELSGTHPYTKFSMVVTIPKDFDERNDNDIVSLIITLRTPGNEEGSAFFDDLEVLPIGSSSTYKIVQVDDYYPFGLRMAGNHHQDNTVTEVRYLYNAKELQDDLGLNWYDYGARMYDMALGRWHVKDPITGNPFGDSPYQYVLNNPLRYVDPEGLEEEEPPGESLVFFQSPPPELNDPLQANVSYDKKFLFKRGRKLQDYERYLREEWTIIHRQLIRAEEDEGEILFLLGKLQRIEHHQKTHTGDRAGRQLLAMGITALSGAIALSGGASLQPLLAAKTGGGIGLTELHRLDMESRALWREIVEKGASGSVADRARETLQRVRLNKAELLKFRNIIEKDIREVSENPEFQRFDREDIGRGPRLPNPYTGRFPRN